MAALVEGQQFSLSSKGQLNDKKTRIFVKLTDSALKAIEDYLSIRATTSRQPTVQFLRSQGVLTFPSAHSPSNDHSFNFSLSSTSDIEGPQGRYECVQQCGNRSLESLGSLQFKMQIHAKEDVYEVTRHRMAVIEEESKKNCTKVIKASGPYGARKKVKVKRNLIIPPKSTSPPPYAKVSSTSNVPVAKPNGLNGLVSNQANGASYHSNSHQFHKNSSTPKNGNPEIMRKSYRERIIHLLALRPYKKPELLARLMKDGIKEKDKKSLSSILSQVAVLRENTFSLARHAWNEIQEDWPFYTDSDRQLLKRRIASNSASTGAAVGVGGDSPPAVQPNSSPSSLTKRVVPETESLPAKKQRISHFNNSSNGSGSIVSVPKADTPPSSRFFDSVISNGGHKGGGGGDASVNSRTESNGFNNCQNRDEVSGGFHLQNRNDFNGYHASLNNKSESNGVGYLNGSSSSSNNNNNNSASSSGPRARLEANGYADHRSSKSDSSGGVSHSVGSSVAVQQLGGTISNGRHLDTSCSSSTNVTPRMALLPSPDGQESNDFKGLAIGSSNDSCNAVDSWDLDYAEKYTEIRNPEQRAQYKADFNSEYNEYRKLHAIVDRVSKRFSLLKESLRNVAEGTEQWQSIKDQIVREYKEMKRDHNYQDVKKRFQYMHEKLAFIKRLVLEYDQECFPDT